MDEARLISLIKKHVRHEISKMQVNRIVKTEIDNLNIEDLIRKIVKEELSKLLEENNSSLNV